MYHLVDDYSGQYHSTPLFYCRRRSLGELQPLEHLSFMITCNCLGENVSPSWLPPQHTSQDQVLHLPSLSLNGVESLHPYNVAKYGSSLRTGIAISHLVPFEALESHAICIIGILSQETEFQGLFLTHSRHFCDLAGIAGTLHDTTPALSLSPLSLPSLPSTCPSRVLLYAKPRLTEE